MGKTKAQKLEEERKRKHREAQKRYRDKKRGGPPRELDDGPVAVYWRKKRDPKKYGKLTKAEHEAFLAEMRRRQSGTEQ